MRNIHQNREGKRRQAMQFQMAHPAWYFSIITGLFLLSWVTFMPSSAPSWLMRIALFVCRSQTGVTVLFAIAVTLHIAEAIFCSLLIYRHNSRTRRYSQSGVGGSGESFSQTIRGLDLILWTLQTLLLGYPSLREVIKSTKK